MVKWLSVSEIEKMTKVPRNKIYRMIKKGELEHIQPGGYGTRILVSRIDVEMKLSLSKKEIEKIEEKEYSDMLKRMGYLYV
jgi:excisionase family DNA binding protein